MQKVVRTYSASPSYKYDYGLTKNLYESLEEGWKVVMCNKIGEDLEYILEKEDD